MRVGLGSGSALALATAVALAAFPGGALGQVNPTPGAPRPPSNLTMTYNASTACFDLKWSDNSTNEAGFEIQVKKTSAGPWQFLAKTGPNVIKYADRVGTCPAYRAYRVCAFAWIPTSPTSPSPPGYYVYSVWSNTVAGQVPALAAPRLALRQAPTCPDVPGTLTVTFAWPAVKSATDHYEVQHCADAVFQTQVVTIACPNGIRTSPLSYELAWPPPPAEWCRYVRVRAIANGCATPWSNVVQVCYPDCCQSPGECQIAATVTATSGTEVFVSWGALPCAASYRVYMVGGYPPFVQDADGVGLNVRNLSPSTTYSFVVVAISAEGLVMCTSNIATATTPPFACDCRLTPHAIVGSGTAITVTWDAVQCASYYQVCVRGGAYETRPLVQNVGTTSFTLQNAAPRTTYQIVVKAMSADGRLLCQSNTIAAMLPQWPQ